MSIVSSTYVLGHAQANGKRYVTETHTTNLGEVFTSEYGPVADGTDYQAIANARAVELAELLADQECEALIANGS